MDQTRTLETIDSFYRETGYLLDPHTAVGVCAARELLPADVARVCLATAHPAKFGEVVMQATGSQPPLPPAIAALAEMPTRCDEMAADLEKLREFIVARVG